MLKIYNKKQIKLTRGDTMQLEVSLQDCKGNPYEILPTDVLYFRLKKSALLPIP